MPTCNVPPKATAAHHAPHYKSPKKPSPCESANALTKTEKQIVTTSLTASSHSSVPVNVNVTLQMEGRRSDRAQRLYVPSAKVVQMKAWTVSVLAGMARTDYTISESTCDSTNCRGVVTRLYIFDVGAQIQYRPSVSWSVGVAVTKEQSIYGSLGFNF